MSEDVSWYYMENQVTIYTWATATFGPADVQSTIKRALAEFGELERAIENGDDMFEVLVEIADVVIILMRAAEILRNIEGPTVQCLRLEEVIDMKMATNRQRKWIPDGHGHGRHKKD